MMSRPHLVFGTPAQARRGCVEELKIRTAEKPLDPLCILWNLEDTAEPMTWSRNEASDDGCPRGDEV